MNTTGSSSELASGAIGQSSGLSSGAMGMKTYYDARVDGIIEDVATSMLDTKWGAW